MGPPPVPEHRAGFPTSNIHLKGVPKAIGYSQAHLSYHTDRSKYAGEVYADKDRLTVQFEARMMVSGERYGVLIGVSAAQF